MLDLAGSARVGQCSSQFPGIICQNHTAHTVLLIVVPGSGCGAPAANEVFTWVQNHLPERVRTGIDVVLLSYYEDDCGGRQPRWPAVFARLGRLFPSARLGFGEIGTTDPARKLRMLERYYTMRAPSPRFVGGYFWWYFRQDMVPAEGNPLWNALDTVMQGRRLNLP